MRIVPAGAAVAVTSLCLFAAASSGRAAPPAPSPPPVSAASPAPGAGTQTPAPTPFDPGDGGRAAYVARRELECADFRLQPGGVWRAQASVSLPGPRGPVRIAAGQDISPGAFVEGMDVAAILEKRCP